MNQKTRRWLGWLMLAAGISLRAAPVVFWAPDIGKNFLLPRDQGAARATLHAADGSWIDLAVTNAERLSLRAQLPASLAGGRFELWIHNGFGGGAGWGGPLAVEIKQPDLRLAKATFAARRLKDDGCWRQSGLQAALLGDTATARKNVELINLDGTFTKPEL